MLTNTYECLAIILRSLRLVANCIRKPIRLIFGTFGRICRDYFFYIRKDIRHSVRAALGKAENKYRLVIKHNALLW